MDNPVATGFTTHQEFGERLRECIVRSHRCLQLFDPDFSVFPLGMMDADAALRQFLADGGTVQLAMHRSAIIERDYPRFMRLLREFSHRIACRATPPNLRQLTDSFCIGDAVNIVRRFHGDHMRGEAAFGSPPAAAISLERFDSIWLESRPCLPPTTIGL